MASPSPPLVFPNSPSPPPPPLPPPLTCSVSPPVPPARNQSSRSSLSLHDLPQVSSNDAIKAYASLSVKISELTTEFIQKLSGVQKSHSQQLTNLCALYRKKEQEIRKNWVFVEGTQFNVWNDLVSTSEDDAKAYMDLSTSLMESVSQDLQTHTARKKLLFKKLFQYRASMTSKVEKTEADLQKCYKEYCDQWSKYGESLEKEQLKCIYIAATTVKLTQYNGHFSVLYTEDNQVLLSYNHHNTYVVQKASFTSLHDVFYGSHVYSMLDEIQSIHKDLLTGYSDSMNKLLELTQKKVDSSKCRLRQLSDVVSRVESAADISQFVSANPSTVNYPPPKPVFQLPENNHPKLPVLSDNLQLIDLTQAHLLHLLDELRKQEQVLNGQREKLQTEYDSEHNLCESYRSNPALGDAHDVEVEMTHMRHVIREKECEIKELAGKLSMFTELEEGGLAIGMALQTQSSLTNDSTAANANGAFPRRTSEVFVQGKEHEWVDFNKKFPVQCRYCAGFVQVPVRPGSVCKVCRICVHSKCQIFLPYCSGEAPTPKSPKLSRMNLKKVYKKIKSTGASFNTTQVKEEEEDGGSTAESTGIYCTIEDNFSRQEHQPAPPPREQSLDPKRRSQLPSMYHRESLFEPSGEWDPPTHCVALYDYEKFNPNDLPLSAGNVIELLNTASTDWWKGSVGDNKGYFPAQYVQVVSPGDMIFKAMYDYSAAGEGEMDLTEGQVVTLGSDESDGWVYAQSGHKEGLIPKNYIQQITIVQ